MKDMADGIDFRYLKRLGALEFKSLTYNIMMDGNEQQR